MDEPSVQTPETGIVVTEPVAPPATSHNSLQNPTKFVPNANQIKWVHTALARASKSPSEIADELGMSRDTFYGWMENPQFREWWEAQWAIYYANVKHRLMEAGVRNAQNDHSWWRDMMEILGFAKPKEEKPATQNTINVMANAFGAKKEGQ